MHELDQADQTELSVPVKLSYGIAVSK